MNNELKEAIKEFLKENITLKIDCEESYEHYSRSKYIDMKVMIGIKDEPTKDVEYFTCDYATIIV